MSKKHYNVGKDNGMYGVCGPSNPSYGVHRYGKDAPAYVHGKTLEDHFCMDCGIRVSTWKTKRCRKCAAKVSGNRPPTGSGKNNPRWSGGKHKKDGYVLCFNPEHPCASKRGYVREHRLVVEEIIGRFLKKGEAVHHINKKRDDNRAENLMAFKNCAAHNKFERGFRVNKEDIIFNGMN